MFLPARLGCALLQFGPYVILGIAVLPRKPQLFVLSLFAMMWSYLTVYVMTSLLYASIQPRSVRRSWSPWCGAAPEAIHWLLGLHVSLWVFQQALQFFSQIIFLRALLWLNSRLRRDNQLMVSGSYRFTPIGAAVGVGYGLASLCVTAAPLLDAECRLVGYPSAWRGFSSVEEQTRPPPALLVHAAASVVAYDLHQCSPLPLLVYRSLQSFLYSIAQLTWGIVLGIAVASLSTKEVFCRRAGAPVDARAPAEMCVSRGEEPPPCERTTSSPTAARGGEDEGADSCLLESRRVSEADGNLQELMSELVEEDPLESEGACRADDEADEAGGRKEEDETVEVQRPKFLLELEQNELNDNDAAFDAVRKPGDAILAVATGDVEPNAPGLPSARGIHVMFPEDSVFRSQGGVALRAMATVLLLQMFFSGVTLQMRQTGETSRGSYECASRTIIGNQGCAMSLPLQLVVTTFSVVTALWMTRQEYCPMRVP